jgi:hypothetical protein
MQWQEGGVTMDGKQEMAMKWAEEPQEEEGYHKTFHPII